MVAARRHKFANRRAPGSGRLQLVLGQVAGQDHFMQLVQVDGNLYHARIEPRRETAPHQNPDRFALVRARVAAKHLQGDVPVGFRLDLQSGRMLLVPNRIPKACHPPKLAKHVSAQEVPQTGLRVLVAMKKEAMRTQDVSKDFSHQALLRPDYSPDREQVRLDPRELGRKPVQVARGILEVVGPEGAQRVDIIWDPIALR